MKPLSSSPEIPASRRGLGLTLLTRTKNPSQVLRALYLSPSLAPHSFLSGSTAENLADSLGETLVDPSYFFTEHRWKEHRRGLGLPDEPLEADYMVYPNGINLPLPLDQLPTGTVGAVALDMDGCIATLTSTGGRTNKLVGRVGDTPVMGARFWAEEWTQSNWIRRICTKITGRDYTKRAVGVSGTGDGDVSVLLLSMIFLMVCIYISISLDKPPLLQSLIVCVISTKLRTRLQIELYRTLWRTGGLEVSSRSITMGIVNFFNKKSL